MQQQVFISASVGREGRNHFTDTRAVQALINHHLPIMVRRLAEDGRCGPLTINAIEEVERVYLHTMRPDERIDPHGPTLRALNAARPARRRHAAQVSVTPAPRPPGALTHRSSSSRHSRTPVTSASARPVPNGPPPATAAGHITGPGITPAAIAAAQATQRRWGVPASITLAQYIQESSAGRHMPAHSHNPFGIKAGRGQPFVMARTSEETSDGRVVHIMAPFRRFDSVDDAFDAHGRLLATGRAYALARQHTDDADAYADALTRHYATEHSYGRNLRELMRQHHLYGYNQ